jgi:queuine tRNA-ribosyltransferase subunit QTRTD1
LKFTQGLHKYLHLEVDIHIIKEMAFLFIFNSSIFFQNQLLFCDVRDALKISPVSFNTDKYLSVETHGGVRQVTPALWAEVLNAYRPDLIATMADTVTDMDAKTKRIKRSVDRTLRWLDDNLEKAKVK